MQHHSFSAHLICAVVVLLVGTHCATAATITFRSEPVTCHDTTVTLGDVAYITPDARETPDEIEKLKRVVLFPAPIAGKDRTVTYREVYDYLNMRGVRVGLHTFAGASQVTVTAETQSISGQNRNANEQTFVRRQSQPGNTGETENRIDKSEELVRHAVCDFLERNVATDVPWQVDVTLSTEGRQQVLRNGEIRYIRAMIDEQRTRTRQTVSQYDPVENWLGRQRFELKLDGISPETGTHRTMFVDVNVSLPKAIVVTRHSVAKGKVINAADVKLHYLVNTQQPSHVTKDRTVNGITTRRDKEPEIDQDVATRIDDVVGKVALRTLRNDTPVQFSQIETPVLIQKSEIVTLFVRNGEITIKMTAKAKENGKSGDVITVESLSDKKTSLARVVDYGTVEIEMRRSETTGAVQLAKTNRY